MIQPSKTRIFNDLEFSAIDCKISEDLSQCHIIIGIREVASELILENKTYLFFSHALKA